jgi:hypothetical protein
MHPIVVISGRDALEILRSDGINSDIALVRWLHALPTHTAGPQAAPKEI